MISLFGIPIRKGMRSLTTGTLRKTEKTEGHRRSWENMVRNDE